VSEPSIRTVPQEVLEMFGPLTVNDPLRKFRLPWLVTVSLRVPGPATFIVTLTGGSGAGGV
jgi:hypothetical protein